MAMGAGTVTTMALIQYGEIHGEMAYLWRTYGGTLVWIGEKTHREWCWCAGWRQYALLMGWGRGR